MNSRWMRAIAVATVVTLSASSIGCGYILYPERRGNRGGDIDGGTMVMDLLWLLPGIIPGVVALIVDFSSGAIYVNGRTALRLSASGRVALRLPESAKPRMLEFRLVTASSRVVARKTAFVGSNLHGQSIELDPDGAMRGNHETIFLEVLDANGASARLRTPIELL